MSIYQNNNSLNISKLSDQELFGLAQKAMAEDFLDHAINLAELLKHRLKESTILHRELNNLFLEIIEKKSNKDCIEILIFGDSLSLPHAEHLKNYHPVVNPFLSTSLKYTYPIALERTLSKVMPERIYRVTNLSKRGYTVRDLVDMRHDIFCWFNPDIIVFHIGLVDAFPRGENLDEQNTTIDEFEKYFNIVMKFRDESCPEKACIFIDISPVDDNISAKYPMYVDNIKKYNEVFRGLTTKYRNSFCLHMDTLFDKNSPYDLLHFDGQHFSTQGHEQVALALSKLIQNQVQGWSKLPHLHRQSF